MGKYVNNGKVTLGSQFEYNVAAAEIAELLNVPRRSDGLLYLSDICTSGNIKTWAKYKPFKSQAEYYNNDEERNIDRIKFFYGISVLYNPNTMNKLVFEGEYSTEKNLPVKRIRDFDGYNHNANKTISIVNAGNYDKNSQIPLKTEISANDSLSILDLMEHFSTSFVDSSSGYRWILVDPFGFIHTIQTYKDFNTLKEQLNNDNYTVKVCIADYQKSLGLENDIKKTTPYVPLRNGDWILGLAAINDSFVSNAYGTYISANIYQILNPYKYKDLQNTISQKWTFDSFNPNMIIGTCKSGKHYLWESMYNNIVLDCCNDDYLFLGFEVGALYQDLQMGANVADNLIEMVVYVDGYTNIWNSTMVYNDVSKTPYVKQSDWLGSLGTKYSGTEWSRGTFRVPLGNFFKTYNESLLIIYFTVHNYLGTTTEQPRARILLRNTGESRSEITTKAELY